MNFYRSSSLSTTCDPKSPSGTSYRSSHRHYRSPTISRKRHSHRREKNILLQSKVSPRLSRRADSSLSPDLSPEHNMKHSYSRSNYKTYDKMIRSYKQNRSHSKSGSAKSSPELITLRQKRMEYSKKINDTSLFAELVKDKHKRHKAVEEV